MKFFLQLIRNLKQQFGQVQFLWLQKRIWVSTGYGRSTNEIEGELGPGAASNSEEEQNDFSLYISTSQGGLLGEKKRGSKLLDMVEGLPRLTKFGSSSSLPSTSSTFQRINADEGQRGLKLHSFSHESRFHKTVFYSVYQENQLVFSMGNV